MIISQIDKAEVERVINKLYYWLIYITYVRSFVIC